MAAALGGMGVLHLAKPEPFDQLIPPMLPGSARAWTYGSGVAELACGALVAAPSTRRLGGLASAALFVAVFPGNVHMAVRAGSPRARAITLARLPLQVPLVLWALRAARGA